jgi:hypothetical protein
MLTKRPLHGTLSGGFRFNRLTQLEDEESR